MPKTTTLALLLGILASEPAAAQHGAPVRQPLPPADVIAKLPPDGGDEFNRLVFEKSPYLLQHARNPVDWYPWGPEAFEVAKREDKPVFLSVGYSTCHWCHVMEHESFEDEEVAKLMNEVFVCVKVDREERPDVDHVYMTVTQAMTGRGGWPMTVMMTPDQRPFFAGTYIPKDARGGRNGMKQLVPLVGEMWEGSRERLLEDANRIVRYLEEQSTGEPGGPVPASVLGEAFDALASRYDEVRGGFLPAPKFPRPHNLRFLLRYGRRTGDAKATEMVLHTLRRMRRGGVWDHVGLGFHRYSTDEEWLLPHFEKMLYDQALIAMTAVEAWQATGEDDMRLLANEILAYVARDMTSPEGGFYSAEDADSEGEEGLFYVWTTEELVEVLGAEDGKLASEVWNAREAGNFIEEAGDGELNGRNVLHLTASLETLAAARETSAEELRLRLEGLRRRLFEHRVGRIHPLKDDKVLTDWNGLMIAAYAMAGRAFDDEGHVTTARRAADFLLARLRGEDGRLFKRYRLGSADLPGMLEDYAFAVWGLLELWETTFDARDLEAAIALTDTMLELFWDGESGGLFLSPVDGEELIVRAKEIYDGAIPSGNSVAALNLVRLARITGKTEYEQRADEILRAFSASIVRGPMAYTQLLLAQDFLVGPSHEVVVVGEPGAADTDDALRALAETFQPNKVVVFRPEGDAGAAIATLAPYTATQRAVDGKATIYVCRDFACLAPTTDVEAALESIASAEGEAEER